MTGVGASLVRLLLTSCEFFVVTMGWFVDGFAIAGPMHILWQGRT
jgi:hypothetical protein